MLVARKWSGLVAVAVLHSQNNVNRSFSAAIQIMFSQRNTIETVGLFPHKKDVTIDVP